MSTKLATVVTHAAAAPSATRCIPLGFVEVAARYIAVTVIAGLSIAALLVHWQGVHPWDMTDYWDAALRLRSGEELYIAGVADRVSEYRYAPWFAYLWVPLTHLPRGFVTDAWIGLLGVAAAAVTIDVGRRGWAGLALGALLGVQLAWWVRGGNVQPLMVAAMYFGLRTRTGPLAIAMGATLKAVPLAFVLVYLARREWGRVGWTLGLTCALAAPLLLHDLSNYGTGVDPTGWNLSLFAVSPVAWAVVAALAGGAAIVTAWRRSITTSVWSAVAALAALPRLFLGDATLLLVAAASPARPFRINRILDQAGQLVLQLSRHELRDRRHGRPAVVHHGPNLLGDRQLDPVE
jgi:hypothetical protein